MIQFLMSPMLKIKKFSKKACKILHISEVKCSYIFVFWLKTYDKDFMGSVEVIFAISQTFSEVRRRAARRTFFHKLDDAHAGIITPDGVLLTTRNLPKRYLIFSNMSNEATETFSSIETSVIMRGR